MGWRAQPTAQVQFDDCKVPADNLVGKKGLDLNTPWRVWTVGG